MSGTVQDNSEGCARYIATGVCVVLLRAGSQGLLTIGYSEVSTEYNILEKMGNEVNRSLSIRRQAAGNNVVRSIDYALLPSGGLSNAKV